MVFHHRIIHIFDEYINLGKFEILTYLGHQEGTIIPKTQNKILKHFEGIVCQVK